MQTKDIISGRYYAFSRWNDTQTPGNRWATRVKVSAAVSGRILIVHPGGEVEEVKARQIICTWVEHKKAIADAKARKAEIQARRVERAAKIKRLLGEEAETLLRNEDAFTARVYDDGSYSREARISDTDMLAFLEAAYATGYRDGQVAGKA